MDSNKDLGANTSQLTIKNITANNNNQDNDTSNILRIKREMISQAVTQISQRPKKSVLAEYEGEGSAKPHQLHHHHTQSEVKLNLK